MYEDGNPGESEREFGPVSSSSPPLHRPAHNNFSFNKIDKYNRGQSVAPAGNQVTHVATRLAFRLSSNASASRISPDALNVDPLPLPPPLHPTCKPYHFMPHGCAAMCARGGGRRQIL
jgi:hypothetical protein